MFADNRLETEIFLDINHLYGLLQLKISSDCKRNDFILKKQLLLNKLLEYSGVIKVPLQQRQDI